MVFIGFISFLWIESLFLLYLNLSFFFQFILIFGAVLKRMRNVKKENGFSIFI